MATVKDKNERDCRIISNANRQSGSLAFNKIKVGNKTLSNDVVLDIGQVVTDKYSRRKKYTKEDVIKAIEQNNLNEQRKISNYFLRQAVSIAACVVIWLSYSNMIGLLRQ